MWASLLVVAAAAAAPAPVENAAIATNPYFHTLSAADGLPSSEVRKLAQDRDGYLWIGTVDGLARYDGVGFRVYRHNPADADSIAGNDVSALFVDRDNRVWCGGEDAGLSMLDARRGAFVHYRHDAKDPHSLAVSDVWAIAQSSDGAIWAGGYGAGLDRLAADGKTFAHFRHAEGNPDGLGSDNVLGLLGDSAGRLWIGTDAGLDVYANGKFRHVDFTSLAPAGTPLNVIGLYEDGAAGMLASTRQGLVRINARFKAVVVVEQGLSDRIVYAATRDAAGDLWIATRGGLDRRSVDGHIDVYLENAALPGSLPANAVFDVLRDHEGGLWFALREAGIARLAPQWRNFVLFRHDAENAASLSGNHVQGLDIDAQGGIWSVNSAGGIDRLDAANGRVERYAERWPVPDRALWSVLNDRAGQLWVGHTRGLRVYELQSGKFTDLAVDPKRLDALARGLLHQLVLGDDGAVWALARGGGMHRIDAVTHRIERFDEAAGTLRNADIDQVLRGAHGELLIAGAAGVDYFDAAAKRFVALAGAPAQRVHALAFAPDGTLWLHVLGALEHYRFDGTSLQSLGRIDAADGWPAQAIGSIAVDAHGVLWIGSPRGLWRVDPATRALRVFDAHEGLANAEFNLSPFVRRTDGRLFGGTLAGIVSFDPAHVEDSVAPPPLLLDALTVRRDGRDVAFDPRAGKLELNWDDRDVRISARALSFANAAANHYQWRLGGIDADWIDSGNRGEREFSQLPPGGFTLKLRAAAANGVWGEAIAPLRIHVAAPPWATRTAYAAYACAAVLAMLLLFRAYRQRLSRRHALELAEQQRRFAEHASAQKSEFLATMGHEIRTPMTGVLGMTELLLRTALESTQRGYAEAIQRSGRVLLRLVNDSLDLARIEAGKLELIEAPFDLHALLREIAALEAPVAVAKGLAWHCTIAADAPRQVRGDAVRVEQVFLNLVNNAIKFTERGSIEIALTRGAHDAVQFAVRDSGPGIAAALRARLFQRFEQADGAQRRAGSGLGLAICRELVSRMGGTITVDSEPGQGSTFSVTLPLAEGASEKVDNAASVAPAAAARRILLVEDDATVAQVTRGLLQAQGHDVMHAANGLAALGLAETERFDAALIDLDLPGVDGLTLARMLRTREAQRALPRLALIGISARSVGDEEALCRAAGMDAFVRKPATGDMLADALRRAGASPQH
jgi:signal transduction histidine kinase/ligand-binding sensor domain-containing protein/CheY-like chemotaxis protein